MGNGIAEPSRVNHQHFIYTSRKAQDASIIIDASTIKRNAITDLHLVYVYGKTLWL